MTTLSATLAIAGKVHFQGDRQPSKGLYFEVEEAQAAQLRAFVRECFGRRVVLSAVVEPEPVPAEQGRLA